MGMEEGEEIPTKVICNIFNKIIAENFPSLEKVLPIQVHEVSRTQTDVIKIEPPHGILSSKQQT
jgi:hypothetical protein